VSGGAVIELRSLRVQARIGVSDAELETERPLLVDLDLHLHDAPATETDRIEDTVDYSQVAALAAGIATEMSHRTLERLAELIADRLIVLPRVAELEVRVAKPAPPMEAEVDHVAVRLRRLTPGS
jgi:dihydroneopterin aldolase